MPRVALLLVVSMLLALAACGDEEPPVEASQGEDGRPAVTATPTPPPTAAEATNPDEGEDLYPDVGPDEPFTLFGRVQVVEAVDGTGEPHSSAVVLFVDDPEGRPHRIVVPSDLALDGEAERVLRDEACGGQVDGEFEVVQTPPGEELGDLLLIGAELSAVDC